MIHGIVQVLVSLWFYYLTRPSRKRIRVTKTPLTPHLYIVKLGLTEGIHYFLIFALKHRLWVRVRTASLVSVSTIYVLSKNKKNITIFHLKIIIFQL